MTLPGRAYDRALFSHRLLPASASTQACSSSRSPSDTRLGRNQLRPGLSRRSHVPSDVRRIASRVARQTTVPML
jgi:hypothetical protein